MQIIYLKKTELHFACTDCEIIEYSAVCVENYAQ